jgi:acetyl-CoA carboxylase biotin carboxyl carrier protein
MALTEEEIIQILKLVEQSSFDEFHLETGELKLVVRKGGCGTTVTEADTAPTRPVIAHTVSADEAVHHVVETAPSRAGNKAAAVQRDGLLPIKAPMLGIAYRRPSPESPPYVEVGSYVKEDDTVCLIEIMKVFTAVKAGVCGHIAEVLIDESIMVEYGQPLFLVKPE